MLQAKLITAGPVGNKCRGCEQKVKAPDIILRVQGEFNKFSGHHRIDNFCSKCAKPKLDEALLRIKELISAVENGPSMDQLGSRKIRSV